MTAFGKTALEYTRDKDSAIAEIETLGYPVIVKPVNLGSSVGIGKAKNRESLEEALDNAFMYADKVLTEHAVEHLREINCSVLGDTDSAKASVCEEPLGSGELLSFDVKYIKGGGSKGAKTAPSDTSKKGGKPFEKVSGGNTGGAFGKNTRLCRRDLQVPRLFGSVENRLSP